MKKLFLNPHLFFLVEDGKIIVWNYEKHEQYVLEKEYFETITKISENKDFSHININIVNDLIQSGIVCDEKPESYEWGWDELSRIFHIGTQNTHKTENDPSSNFMEDYLHGCEDLKTSMPEMFLKKEGREIKLPTPDITIYDSISFYDVIKNRKTSRVFHSKEISLENLSTILFGSFGLIHGYEWKDFSDNNLMQTGIRKASPASGGLHAEEAYVIVYRVTNLEPGLYYYHPKLHALFELKLGQFESKVIGMNFNQTYSSGLAFGVYITARFDKSWWKYKHSRSYRVVMLDIGHVSQTFQLCATALNLNTWITGAFKDTEVSELLGVNGKSESPILFIGAGIGEKKSFSKWFGKVADLSNGQA